MRRYAAPAIAFAATLSMLAGYVDAIGFLSLGGFFVSFMSGNSTRLGVGLATAAWPVAATAGSLVASFVGGVIAGTALGRRVPARRRTTAVLLLVALLLAAAALPVARDAAMLALAAAMGAENTIFEREREVSVGLTYMTGTLVKLGQHVVTALEGGPAFGWARYLLLWLGLVSGTVIGALGFARLGAAAIWPGAAAALMLAALAGRLSIAEPDGG